MVWVSVVTGVGTRLVGGGLVGDAAAIDGLLAAISTFSACPVANLDQSHQMTRCYSRRESDEP
jgi:hypothetical protein